MSDTDQRQEHDRQSPVPAPRVLGELAADLRSLIDTTRLRVARTVNAELVMLYWEIGSRIRRNILGDARAEYGNQIVSTLSRQLTAEYGAGFSRQNLFHMIRFVEAWPEQAQLSALAQHLGWSHFKEISYLESEFAPQFPRCSRLLRSPRTRRRFALRPLLLSRLPSAKISSNFGRQTADTRLVFRDPYLLDFLGLKDTFSERDLEAAILQELERFLLELGRTRPATSAGPSVRSGSAM